MFPLRLLLACALSATGPTLSLADEAPEGMRLAWSDEFNEDGRLDDDKWGYERGFVRNSELQWYQPENAFCRDGCLVIEGKREEKDVSGARRWGEFRRRDKVPRDRAHYTAASVLTRGKFHWQFGRLEVRAKVTSAPGLWPAIWTLGESGRWPACGEVDVMECYDGGILANAAWRPRDGHIEWDSTTTPVEELGENWDSAFHTWTMDWDEREIVLSVDGRVLNRTNLDEVEQPGGLHPFRQPHYLLLNLAIGGTRGGDASRTEFPSEYLIDYVRIYQALESSEDAPADAS